MATTETVGGISFALTDEQKELRALAREFAAKEIRPKAAEYDERSHHPGRSDREGALGRLMNLHVPEEYGGLALSSFDGMLVGEELNWGCSGIGTSIGANGLGSGPVILAGTRGAEGHLAAAAPRVADPVLVRSLGARRRLGRRAPADDGGAARRRVRPERLEDLHHQRRLRGLDGRLRQDRPGQGPSRHVGVHRPDGRAGRHDRAAPRQDGAALDRHLRVRARATSSCPPRTGSAPRARASRSR